MLSTTMVRIPGQFSRPQVDLVVATPTCCCCCCCCLVSTTSVIAYSAAIPVAETRKVDAPRARRVGFGVLGAVVAVLALVLGALLADSIVPAAAFLALPAFVVALMKVTKIASGGSRSGRTQLGEAVVMLVVFGIAFGVEFVTLGFLIYGQAAALVAPFVVLHLRGWKGVTRVPKNAAAVPSE